MGIYHITCFQQKDLICFLVIRRMNSAWIFPYLVVMWPVCKWIHTCIFHDTTYIQTVLSQLTVDLLSL